MICLCLQIILLALLWDNIHHSFKVQFLHFVAATKHYYSIKGDKIVEEQNISVFQALSNIVEVNYADLKQAANLIVNGNSEGVLLTDGEYYQKNIAGGGISDP